MAAGSVLVVDDDPDIVDLTTMVLEGAGYRVRAVTRAEDVEKAVRTFRPGLIMMDVRLPGMDGLELTRRLRKDPATRDLVILVHSAHASKSDEQSALQAGCDAYLVKPARVRDLLDAVSTYLSSDGAERKGRRARRS